MILNPFALLVAFLALLRGTLSLLTLVLGFSAFWTYRSFHCPDEKKWLEDRSYLLFLLAFLLLGLNVASWPLFYWLLQSWVPEWPGVMCIYGVTQIGSGSVGPSRFLPGLLQTLQISKPVLVFLSGAWFVLYWLNRRTQTAPLMGRILVVLIALGSLGLFDSTVEGAYLIIPKKEEFLSAGCCTQAFDFGLPASHILPEPFWEENHPGLFSWAYYLANFIMILALFRLSREPGSGPIMPWLTPLLLGAGLTLLLSAFFLIEVAAPTLLHLPYHHCPYDLIPQVPETIVAVGLFIWGSFSVGWAHVAGCVGNCTEVRPWLNDGVRRILFLGLFGFVGSLAMMTIELALAQL